MQRLAPEKQRELRQERLSADLVVVGGGMAGVCCSITAARAGAKVVLVQDRPVLGGNASSEVRLWMVGATSHMGNNNRWAREGGVFDEICVENTYRNPEGNPVIFDTVLLEKAFEEPNLNVLLNTTVFNLEKASNGSRIDAVEAFCSQNSTRYHISAPLFCDSSGDGVVAFMAGAPFRYGAESRQEFGEMLAPSEEHTQLLGQSIFFYTRDTGKPVRFVPPKYSLEDIKKIPRYRRFNTKDYGCQLWWIEYGGSLDTIHDTETIKWELWKVVYGVWNYIKNSGEFPEAETMTLDWVGTIPGKRESRRFEGDYMLIQQDIVDQRTHYDAVSVGGWAIDEHPVDSVYSDKSPCTQWHSKGVYQIPYRTMFSRSVDNLFLAGRIVSASHLAFCSSRVMATCAHNGQAVGVAAAICGQEGILPRDLAAPGRVGQLQQALLRAGQFIPGHRLEDQQDLATKATVTASSQLDLGQLQSSNEMVDLCDPRAMLIPLQAGAVPVFEFEAQTDEDTTVVAQLRTCSRPGSYSPDTVLKTVRIPLRTQSSPLPSSGNQDMAATNGTGTEQFEGPRDGNSSIATKAKAATETKREVDSQITQKLTLDFQTTLSVSQYAFVCLLENPHVLLEVSDKRVTGVLSLVRRHNHRVATDTMQTPPEGSGIDSFEFWTPERRPVGRNLSMRVRPELEVFGPAEAVNGYHRPTTSPNAWVASFDDQAPTLKLKWDAVQTIERIELVFDTDLDHPMESVVMRHFEPVSPFCVRNYRILGFNDEEVFCTRGNYQTRNTIRFDTPLLTDVLKIELVAPNSNVPASLYEVRCYGPTL
ncbi:MAG: FAD-dependent oxidoreductase [Aeoliella sp.]